MQPAADGKHDDPATDDQLVAYLDGELDPQAQDQVERQLATDSGSRERLRTLQQTWDLLEHLPNAQTDRSFTESTVEMVAARVELEVSSQQQAIVRRRRLTRLSRGAWLAATVALGYAVVWAFWASYQHRQLRDLPIVANYDLYRYADSIQFIRDLNRDGLFAAEDDVDASNSADTEQPFTNIDLASVRTWAQALTPAEKSQLREQNERFDRLAPELQERMRRLHADVSADADAERLMRVSAQYHEWLKSLTPLQRSELLELPPDQRLAQIEKIKSEQDAKRFRLVAKQATEADFPAIVAWFRDFKTRHMNEIDEQEIADKLPTDVRQRWEQWDPERRRMFLMQFLPLPSSQEIERLAARLSPDARRALTAEREPAEQAKLVMRWMRAAFYSRRRPHIDSRELERFFLKELDSRDRERLVGLSKEQLERELRHLYFQRRAPRTGPGGGPLLWGRPPFGGPPGLSPRRLRDGDGDVDGPPPRSRPRRFEGRRGGFRDDSREGRRGSRPERAQVPRPD